MERLKLKVPPIIWCAFSLSLMWWLSARLPLLTFCFPKQDLLALGCVFTGFSVALSGVATFRKARTTVDPLAPQKAASLVRDGIYSHTRNPMYLAMTLVQIGWFLHLGSYVSVFPVLGFVLVMTQLQIVPEEKALGQIFGREYDLYRAEVPRWI